MTPKISGLLPYLRSIPVYYCTPRERRLRGSGNKHLRDIIAETHEMLLLYMIVEKEAKGVLDRPKGDGAMHQPSSRRAPYETLEQLVLRTGYVHRLSYLALGVIAGINRKQSRLTSPEARRNITALDGAR